MRIAIVAPSPYHFVMGGAEHFWLGLQRYINEETAHSCELIKIPTREGTTAELVDSYLTHAKTDVLGFDRVVTSKYPSWMLHHPNHALFMLHTLRGLYDTYHFMREPTEVDWQQAPTWLRPAIDKLEIASPDSNAPVIDLLTRFAEGLRSDEIDATFARHPGPSIRHLIHALDRFALQPARIKQHATMSRTVASRADYFPGSVDVKVIPPPTRLEGFWCGGDDYIFTVSRLDGPKRVGLLIEAMKHAKSGVPLWIAGSGPEEARLKALAGDDPRIRFLGPLTDAELIDAYANCLAVAFVPYDEDYGLVTVEAMRSRKPVLTVSDAGGVTEFVTHGETGYCVPAEAATLGVAMDALFTDKRKTRMMGENAQRRVASISWQPLAEFALGTPLPASNVAGARPASRSIPARKKAIAALTFPITPPRGGGQSRVFHLYKVLAKEMDISLVCLCGPEEPPSRVEIAPGFWEIRVPKSPEHQRLEAAASSEVNWIPVTDIVAAREIEHTPAFLEALRREGEGADVAIACHPFFTSTLTSLFPDIPLWLEAHNVELTLKTNMLPASPAAKRLLKLVEDEEGLAWRRAKCVFACAERDLDELAGLYGASTADRFGVPNGFAEEEVTFTPLTARRGLRQRLGLGDGKLAIFLGSWHGPNLEACEIIMEAASALPEVTFAIVGSAGEYFRDKPFPANVKLLGPVDEEVKQVLLSAADVALNPMRSGSGSNLKMLDYFAAGVPVISTEFGARGIDALPSVHYQQAPANDLVPALVQFLISDTEWPRIVEQANTLARNCYSWRVIGATALERFRKHLNR